MSIEGKIGSVGHYTATLNDDGTAAVNVGVDFAKPEWNLKIKGDIGGTFDPIALAESKLITDANKDKWYSKAVSFLVNRLRKVEVAALEAKA